MANIPVATLRIWEQRYGAVQPATAASGHRLYSLADVQRVLLLRRLTEQGHAIGTIAALDSTQLQEMAGMPAGVAAGANHKFVRPAAGLRMVVVGLPLAARLQRPAVVQHLSQPLRRMAVFESLDEAVQASSGMPADLLLWHAPELLTGVPPALPAAQQSCGARQAAVVYRFAGASATKAFADTGAVVIREPIDDDALGSWLASMEATLRSPQDSSSAREAAPASPALANSAVAPRRFDDATLTAIAGLPPQLFCECPRHVAELLMQLASFEAYSAGCSSVSAADAQVHAYLQQVAGTARALFESALERVARHAGLPLR
ncbi:MerR family transcriptional regulator [Noviherbaspirillum sp. DKR-6]|uniref:MerR family transcriptional regulator n=2 Tax=Noviherbaspirillum pedocola TaxID=2801341 RepID=A0A934W1I8_9BURK|nr:MerR family transcriptional regulator [Noviherbaspirillum pedocola]